MDIFAELIRLGTLRDFVNLEVTARQAPDRWVVQLWASHLGKFETSGNDLESCVAAVLRDALAATTP